MLQPRVIPCLLLKNGGLVKTVKFKDARYIGDPINAVKIFNEKEVDELMFLDISATVENHVPPFDTIGAIASECFMPMGYGGGVRNLEDVRRIIGLGVEKVAVNSFLVENPDFISEVASCTGSQSLIASIDTRKHKRGHYEVFTHGGTKKSDWELVRLAQMVEAKGAGEIMLTSIDHDGTMQGYDIELIKSITACVNIPVVASGGAGSLDHIRDAIHEGGASACAIGSMAVYYGKSRAVLITYPTRQELNAIFT